MRGKEICNLLKAFRNEIADKNSIDYVPHPCHYEGECEGSCPLCEQEANYILEELKKRNSEGLSVNTETDLLKKLEEYKYSLERIQTTCSNVNFNELPQMQGEINIII